MPTQLMPTPTIKGENAKKIYDEANQKRRKEAEEGLEKLKKKFENKIEKK